MPKKLEKKWYIVYLDIMCAKSICQPLFRLRYLHPWPVFFKISWLRTIHPLLEDDVGVDTLRACSKPAIFCHANAVTEVSFAESM